MGRKPTRSCTNVGSWFTGVPRWGPRVRHVLVVRQKVTAPLAPLLFLSGHDFRSSPMSQTGPAPGAVVGPDQSAASEPLLVHHPLHGDDVLGEVARWRRAMNPRHPAAIRDAALLLDIDVEQFTRLITPTAHHGSGRPVDVGPGHAVASQDPPNGAPRLAQRPRDPVRPFKRVLPVGDDRGLALRRDPMRNRVAATIGLQGPSSPRRVATQPLVCGRPMC